MPRPAQRPRICHGARQCGKKINTVLRKCDGYACTSRGCGAHPSLAVCVITVVGRHRRKGRKNWFGVFFPQVSQVSLLVITGVHDGEKLEESEGIPPLLASPPERCRLASTAQAMTHRIWTCEIQQGSNANNANLFLFLYSAFHAEFSIKPLGQGVAISTTAFTLPRFFVQTHIFSVSPSSLSL